MQNSEWIGTIHHSKEKKRKSGFVQSYNYIQFSLQMTVGIEHEEESTDQRQNQSRFNIYEMLLDFIEQKWTGLNWVSLSYLGWQRN